MAIRSQAAVPQESVAEQRRYVPMGKRLVPLSALIAVIAVAAAAVLAWRLYSPPWAGGVRQTQRVRQPQESRVINAPGPDNTITALPPPEKRIITGEKPPSGDKPTQKQEEPR